MCEGNMSMGSSGVEKLLGFERDLAEYILIGTKKNQELEKLQQSGDEAKITQIFFILFSQKHAEIGSEPNEIRQIRLKYRNPTAKRRPT